MSTTLPMLGETVIYRLNGADAADINAKRSEHDRYKRSLGMAISTGHIGHTGNYATAGDPYPATVVKTFDETAPYANLQVHLDGTDTYWATSRSWGTDQGQWLHLTDTHTTGDTGDATQAV